jgi:hypothetical protein
MINEAFIVGSSLYTMSIQMLVAKAVLQDRDQYARILPNNVNGLKIQAKSYSQRHETIPNRDYYIRQSGIDPIEI